MATATARGGAAGSAGAGTALGYSLGLAASVLYLGAVGDHYGRRMMLAAGVLLSGGQWASRVLARTGPRSCPASPRPAGRSPASG